MSGIEAEEGEELTYKPGRRNNPEYKHGKKLYYTALSRFHAGNTQKWGAGETPPEEEKYLNISYF